jgi:AraC-like DNA-binding protein
MGPVDAKRDSFEALVDLVADRLGDPCLTSCALADAAFMSRSHFDRMVKAATGESPSAFRRRLRLERAAFQLLQGGGTILEVAVAAGYGSHEAFTRAFTRAYGVAPAAWRARRASTELPCPNGVHFYPPSGLVLPPRKKVTEMDFVPNLVEHHVWVLGQMLDRAQGLTQSQLAAPIELSVAGIDERPTIRSVLARLVGQLDMWNRARRDEPYDVDSERGLTLQAMRARLDQAGPAFLEHVQRVTREERLGETYVDTTGERPYTFTAAAMIAHVLTYAAHRRTLVVGALESAGAAPVQDDPLVWFGARY